MSYDTLPIPEIVTKTAQMLAAHNIEAIVVENGIQALEKIKEWIPKGASVMNGSSRTLEQIGFVEYLKSGKHGWNNLHEAIVTEKDPAQQAILRKQAALSDFYLGSVHALAEIGEFVVASNTGSQLPNIVGGSANLIFIVGIQKIVKDLPEALKRLDDYVIPLENENMQKKYGVGTMLNKVVIFKGENKMTGRKVTIILINEKLGF